jgi:hypothetical protein
MTGLVGFLAIESEVQRAGRRTGLNFDSFVHERSTQPRLDPISNVDADETVRGVNSQIHQLW